MPKDPRVKEPEGAMLDIVYRPVWEVERPSVDLFYAKPILRLENGDEVPGSMPLVRLDTVEATMKRQCKYLKLAFETLTLRFDRGERFRLMVRINSVALATQEAASEVTDAFRLLTKDQRKCVVVEISDFPQNLSVHNMDDITIPLMPFFDTLVARPAQDMTDYTLFANLNYASVLLDLSDKAVDLKLAGQLFKLFSSRAELRRLPMWIFGLSTLQLAKLARISQAAVLSGAYMDCDSLLPGPVIEGNQPFMV